MDEISQIFLGKNARPKDKIILMGDLVISSLSQEQEKSDEEIRSEVMSRFMRLGLKNRANSALFLEEEISSNGFKSVVYFLYRLSLTLEDAELFKRPRIAPTRTLPSSFQLNENWCGMRKKEWKSSVCSPDDGCIESGRDESPSMPTRTRSANLSKEYIKLLKTRRRADPAQCECIEVSASALSSNLFDAMSGKSSFIFRLQDGLVDVVQPLVISNHSLNQTKVLIRPIISFVNELLLAERSILDMVASSGGDLPSQLCQVVLNYLKNIRIEAILLLHTRPFPSPRSIKMNIESVIERGIQFISLSRQLLKLRHSSCSECIDCLVTDLSHEYENELTIPILHLLKFALITTLDDAESFMLSGVVSPLGLIVECENGSTLNEPYKGGRNEGEMWRKNYGIVVGHSKSIDKNIAEEIMAEGKLALMRLRDPSLVDEFSAVGWKELKEERKDERRRIVMDIERGITIRDIKELFKDSIKWVRRCGDRSTFLSRQICLVANSLEIVWQVFLLGDRVTRVPHFDGSPMERFQSMRDAIAAFPHHHLLAVEYASKTKSARSSFIQLRVSGALSIVVSSSNISIYTNAHKLLSKSSQVYHKISQAYLCLPPLRKGCDEILRGLHKALADITNWMGKLCGHFCTQVHEVVWKQTNKEVLTSLPSFDVLFSIHRKSLKDLATRLFLLASTLKLSSALNLSIDASSEFAVNLECEEWEKAARSYINFIEAAQMFTHGLMVEDDPLLIRSQLLSLIDPNERFRMYSRLP